MLTRQDRWLSFAYLAFALIYPSTALFKKLGYSYMAGYCITSGVMLWLAIFVLVPILGSHFRTWMNWAILAIIYCVLFIAYLWVHPRIDTEGFAFIGGSFGASDGDDAIDIGIAELIGGRYPYYARTFLDNPITPMPGSLLLALPFYLLGSSAAQNIFWLALFSIATGIYYRSSFIALFLTSAALFLSPNVIYNVLHGGDYISNSISVLFFTALLLESTRRRASVRECSLWAILLGVALSSRLNFVLVVPSLFVALVKASSRASAILLTGVMVLSFGAVTVRE